MATEAAESPRLQKYYQATVVPALQKEFGLTNAMQIPRLQKVGVNIGLGRASQNQKLIEGAVEELSRITGQKPVVTRAKKSIATFKLRENAPIGVMVTLLKARMW